MVQAVEEYLAALEAGRRPDRPAFLARHPEIADAAGRVPGRPGVHPGGGPAAAAGRGRRHAPTAWPRTSAWRRRWATSASLREVGRGGMGVVYEAEQISLGRRVALKVLPFAATLDPRQLQRFQNEAQAAAQPAPHATSCRSTRVGCERGVHYYAMQFIDGQTLAAVIRELRGGRPGRRTRAAGRRHAGRRADRPTGRDQLGPRPTPAAADGRRAAGGGRCRRSARPRSPAYFRTVAAAGACRRPRRWSTPTSWASSTATSSRPTCWWTAAATCGSPTSAWPRSRADAGLTLTGDLLGTLRYMSPEQALAQHGWSSTTAPTSTRWARRCTSC